MTSLRKDLRAIVQNLAASAIWAVIVLIGATLLPLITPLRGATIPLWIFLPILLFLLIWIARLKLRLNASAPILEIQSAHYGASYQQVDVTAAVQRRIQNGVLDLVVSNYVLCAGADPFHGISKYLTIRYTLDRRERTIILGEGSHIILP
jgi:hypothetical protein